MLTKRSPQQRKILIIKWIRCPILCILCLFSTHCCNHSVGTEMMAMMTDEDIHGLSNMKLLSPKPTWLQSLLIAQSASNRYNTEFPIRHHPSGWSASYPVADDYTKMFSSRKKQSFILSTIDTLDIHLLFLHERLLPKLLTMNLQNALFIIMIFYIALLLIRKLISHSKKI